MKRLLMGTSMLVVAIAIAGCATKNKNERIGDRVFIYNEPNSGVAKKQADILCGGKSYSIGIFTDGYTGKPSTMRIPFACSQKEALANGSYEAKREVDDASIKNEMKRLAAIPWSGHEAAHFFLKERHYFLLMECGWAGSVGFSTGKQATVLLGSSYYKGEKATFTDGMYKLTFNGGSMAVTYRPQAVKGDVRDLHSVTPCELVKLGEDD